MADCKFSIPSYIPQGCDLDQGRIVALALIDTSVTFADIETATEWLTQTYDTDIIVFQEVSGSYAKPSPTEVAGKGNQDVRVVGRKHEIIVRIPGIKGNDAFWNAVNKSTTYKIAFVTGGGYDILWYVDKACSIDAGPEITEDLSSQVDWVVNIKWDSIDLPATYDVPSGVFN